MSRKPPSTAEQRLQILEVLSTRVDEVRAETTKISAKVETVQLTLSNMQGANIIGQITENKQSITELEKRIRVQENWKRNMTGRMTVIVFLVSLVTAILTGLTVKLIGGH